MSTVSNHPLPPGSQVLWRPTSLDFEWKWWDDDAVVFNPLSGDTHRLNLVESTVLQTICDAPGIDPAGLTAQVAITLGIPCDQQLNLYVSTLLAQFEELGLIETATA